VREPERETNTLISDNILLTETKLENLKVKIMIA